MEASPGRRHQLDALADPTRRAILELLRERPLTAGEIAARFSQQRPAISKHLTLLRTTGWLAESRDRQRRIYSLRNDAVVVVVDWARRLGEATIGSDPVVASAPAYQSPKRVQAMEPANRGAGPEAGVVGSKNESEISDLRFPIGEVRPAGPTVVQSEDSGAASQSASRSSFELIFD